MRDVYIVGVGMTDFGRHLTQSVKSLTRIAVTEALEDSGVEAGDLDAAYFGNTAQGLLEGQYMIGGQIALGAMGIRGIPVVNVENACATGTTAFHMAVNHVRSGAANVALAVGVDKLLTENKAKGFEIFNTAWDVETPEENIKTLIGGYFSPENSAADGRKRSMFMDLYNHMARHHMEAYGTTQRQMAVVSSKNHFHSTMNSKSQYQRDMSVEEVLAAPIVTGPLTIPMCSPISDGAAAAIVVSGGMLHRFKGMPVKILATVLRSGTNRDARDYKNHITTLAAQAAYEQAGLGPKDMSVAEVHDAAAFGEILQSECLGFAPFGEGGVLAESGATRLGGSIPINPSGGLESKGHPIGATGLGQIYELTQQLRGRVGARQVENARFAIAENGGGLLGVEEASACVTILGNS
ncbi:thiolase family protein [Amphritea opalescens]|uniref:Thiolase family protein n=1 Tax=Amphritea opalescens TaxID=2490544 RepID=A0A430KLQ5_9GAMM|nr:thiolase family protein [Amphritea opalescens]RTE64405.1 thiolase family protein [Amphritea opalescens]